MAKRPLVFDPIPPPPAPSLRPFNPQSKPFNNNFPENLRYDSKTNLFTPPSEEALNVFEVIRNCGIAVPSIFGPVVTPTEYHTKILKSYYYTIRILLFYHYRKGGTLESVVKNRDNLLIFDSKFDAKTLICTPNNKLPNASSNYFDKWHLIYYERKSLDKIIIFRSVRTNLLNDYSKYILSLLNISTKTASHILTMLLYKTLSCSENSFLKLVKTLFSSFTNFNFSLLVKIAIEFVKQCNLPIMTLRRLADRWLPVFISQQVPHSEDLFVQLILSSPDQIPHFHTSIGDDTCIKCSNSILFSLSLLKTTRQFLSIIAKYPLVSKIAFTYFASLAKDERFGEYGLMLKTEATNAIVQLWLSPARSHILTLGPYVLQVLGEMSRLQTIQINVWKHLLEEVDVNGFKLVDVMIGNSLENYHIDIFNQMGVREYALLGARFLRPYCVNNVNAIEKNFFLAPLIVGSLLSLKSDEYVDILVKLLIDLQENAPLSYLCSARLSLFIPSLSFQHLTLLKLNIGGLLTDEFISQCQNMDPNKLPNIHLHDLGESKDLYLALPDMYNYSPPACVSQILYKIMQVDATLCVSLLDFLVQLILYYHQSPDLSYLSLLLGEGSPITPSRLRRGGDRSSEEKEGGEREEGERGERKEVSWKCLGNKMLDVVGEVLGIRGVVVSIKGLVGSEDYINVPLDQILFNEYIISPHAKVLVDLEFGGLGGKMKSSFLGLMFRHMVEFYIYRHINGGYYKALLLKNYDKFMVNGKIVCAESLGNKDSGTLHLALESDLRKVEIALGEEIELCSLGEFIEALLDPSEREEGQNFDEFVGLMAEKFDDIDFDELQDISNEYGYIGELIGSYFLARVLAKHLYGDAEDAYSKFVSDAANYPLAHVLAAVKGWGLEKLRDIPHFLLDQAEFQQLIDNAKIKNIVLSPFNIVTDASFGLSKWESDWVLIVAKVTGAMSTLGSAKAASIFEKINRNFSGHFLNKISINGKRDLRNSCLIPFSVIDLSVNKIAEYLQNTNNVEYVFTALNILWSLIISSQPRIDLVSSLIKILITSYSQIGSRQVYTAKMKYLNNITFLICFTVLLWITADPLQSLITFRQITPPGSPSALILWNGIEKFLKTGLAPGTQKCKFNQVSFKISKFTLPLTFKMLMNPN